MIKKFEVYNNNIAKVLKNEKFEELKDKTVMITGANRINSVCNNRYC